MIPLFKVFIPSNIGQTLQEVFDGGTVTEGKYSDKFEQDFGKMLKNESCALVNSCTSALSLAYRCCNVVPGKKVISTPFTCMATNEPIDTMGAEILWADIEKDTGNICPKSVEKLLLEHGKDVVAIVGVHWAGSVFKVDEIRQILKKLNLENIKIIEDAAHALLSKHQNGNYVGETGDFVCFSFQAIKHLTTVDGGAILSNNSKELERIKLLRWFGLDRKFTGSKWTQDIKESGYKFHMNNVNAAIGLRQLETVEENVAKHKANGKYYDQNIKNKKVQLLNNSLGESSYWIYTVLVEDREDFSKYLFDNGIVSDVVHVRNDKYSVFEKFKVKLPGVDYFCSRHINIPVGWWLTEEEKKYIVDVVNKY